MCVCVCVCEGFRGVMVIFVCNEHGNPSSNPVYVSQGANTLGIPSFPPTMGKYLGNLRSLTLV